MRTRDAQVAADSIRALARFLEGEDIRLSDLIDARPDRLRTLAAAIEMSAPGSDHDSYIPGTWEAWPISVQHCNGAVTIAATWNPDLRGKTVDCLHMDDGTCNECNELVD